MKVASKHASMYWILLLLAALFFGPLFVQDQRQPFGKSQQPLSAALEQSRVLDAPGPKPGFPPSKKP